MPLVSLLLALAFTAPPDSLPKRFKLLPLPLVYYTPETRLAYGVAATATFQLGARPRPADTTHTLSRPSQVTFGVAYTQNKQILFYLPFNLFWARDTYYANGEVGYYRYNYFFFGLGQREVEQELYGVDFPRIRVNAFRRIVPRLKTGKLYAGLRYQYEDYRVTSVEPGGLLASGTVPGGTGSRLSGGGLGLFYDRRNQIFFPTQGLVADLTYLNHHPALGSGVRFTRYGLDVSSYHSLNRHAVLALNYALSGTVGTAPFNALSLLGGTKRMRGYYEGRFRDDNLALLQAEIRFDLYRRLGAVVFGSVGVLGDNRRWLRPDDPKGAYGGGLRFTLNRRDHLNLRLDYGIGRQSTGFYLTIGEAF
ncbi:BamA/TamA family outer membrane protein [Rudanella paleaurantiibacter]|uniref:BamA/TamA family outer membrane protein n=1 Tax=Rudanella paleaurantiibacter TaxID=2614655 RepID=A0A7J5TW53_9BACT|nr:BamA/TamA family outer membrane protein [Rudanella paleaurantiibacter]KAB7728682.1 BamA/TamA family outer membrane protein [Rudanella paleaurantiibacter]